MRVTLLVSHAPFPGGQSLRGCGGAVGKSTGARPEVLGARWVEPPSSPCGPDTFHKMGGRGSGWVRWPLVG